MEPAPTTDAPPSPAPTAAALRAKKTAADLGWETLLGHLAARTHTTRGAAAARSLEPSLDAGWIRGRLAEVSEARALWDRGEPMPYGSVYDLEAHLARAEKGGFLDGSALREVAVTLVAGRRLRKHLAARGGLLSGQAAIVPRLAGRAALIAELADVVGAIEDAFDDVGQLLDTASPELGPLRRRAAGLREELERRSHALLDAPGISPHLQDRFYTRREDRFVLPIRIDARTRVKGIVHGISGSGQTVFVEPEEIIDLNNRLKLAELEVVEEERRILGELTLLVADVVQPIRANLEILTVLDVIDASARMSIDYRGQEPVVDERGLPGYRDDEDVPPEAHRGPPRLDLRRARHPLMLLSGRECVPNDIVLATGGTLVVSGPNAGGKTVALKTAGLISLMVRAGLHAPLQEGSTVPLFHTVLTDVGDDQSLERNLSTFSAHVMNLNAFLAAAGPGVLVLLDEIAVGTDPDQGAALADAVLESLADRGATVIVTTHYERLKALAARDGRFANASVGFDMVRLAPTYELHLGVPGASGALVVARRLGLPEAIAARAELLLDGKSHAIEALLAQVEVERQRLSEAASAAEHQTKAAEDKRLHAEELAREAAEQLRAARRGEHDDAVGALRRARLELERIRAELKRQATLSKEALERAERAVDHASKEVVKHAPPPTAPIGRPVTPADVYVGAEVVVPRLGGIGVVTTASRAGKVGVQVGMLKLTVDEAELMVPIKKPVAPTSAYVSSAVLARSQSAPPPANAPVSVRTTGNTMDLRGERVDAALALAEKFLDEAFRGHQPIVFFIHGHGTGALRTALREHLTGYPGVATLRPGDPTEGGDGVTVLHLR